jgi:hypothetical protein
VHADGPAPDTRLRVGEGEHGGDVVHDRRDRHLGAHGAHALMLGAAVHEDVGAVLGVASGAVVEVGQQHAIS